MQTIKVLGTGCANCKSTQQLIESVAQAKGVEINLVKEEDIAAIMSYGVMSTPGVVIDDKVVHSGGIPERATVEAWLAGESACCSISSSNSSGGSCCG